MTAAETNWLIMLINAIKNRNLWIFIAVFFGCVFGMRPGGAQKLKVGDMAPEFTLKALDGATVSLSDFKGKVIFIDFFGYN